MQLLFFVGGDYDKMKRLLAVLIYTESMKYLINKLYKNILYIWLLLILIALIFFPNLILITISYLLLPFIYLLSLIMSSNITIFGIKASLNSLEITYTTLLTIISIILFIKIILRCRVKK